MRYAWDLLDSLAVVDDNYLPYLAIPTAGGALYSAADIDAFIVALPEKVYYPADAVDRLAPALFKFSGIMNLPAEKETIVRYFITTGSALRRFVREHESEYDPKLVAAIMTLPFAQFVWIIEFATDAQWQLRQVAARAVVDATASLREVMPLWLLYTRDEALVFDRQSIPPKIGALKLSNPAHTAYTRMVQNLRPTQAK
jgi:hypothetical protein